jgi:hypothetical protein
MAAHLHLAVIEVSRSRLVLNVLPTLAGRVPWSGGIEGVVVNLSDVLELVARS